MAMASSIKGERSPLTIRLSASYVLCTIITHFAIGIIYLSMFGPVGFLGMIISFLLYYLPELHHLAAT